MTLLSSVWRPLRFWAIVTMIVGVSVPVFAHTHLMSSIPMDKAQLDQVPEQLSLTFMDEVTLLQLRLTNSQDENIDLHFSPNASKQKTFLEALPELEPDRYQVHWSIIGVDGHRVAGDFSFRVDE